MSLTKYSGIDRNIRMSRRREEKATERLVLSSRSLLPLAFIVALSLSQDACLDLSTHRPEVVHMDQLYSLSKVDAT